MPHVYLLRCRDGSLYTGIAKDLSRRLAEHAGGRASRYTRSRLPVTLAWSRRVRTWRRALQEEHRIKALSRPQKDALVASGAKPSQRRPPMPPGKVSRPAPSQRRPLQRRHELNAGNREPAQPLVVGGP